MLSEDRRPPCSTLHKLLSVITFVRHLDVQDVFPGPSVLCRAMPGMSHAPHALQARAGHAIRGMQRGPALPPDSLLPLRNSAGRRVRSALHGVPWQYQQGCLQVSDPYRVIHNRHLPSITRLALMVHTWTAERHVVHIRNAMCTACSALCAACSHQCHFAAGSGVRPCRSGMMPR